MNSISSWRFDAAFEPKSTEGDRSSRNQAVISRSSLYSRTCGICSARGDVPVDVPDVVVELVFAQVRQVEAEAPEQGAVVALQQAVEPADHGPVQPAQDAFRAACSGFGGDTDMGLQRLVRARRRAA